MIDSFDLLWSAYALDLSNLWTHKREFFAAALLVHSHLHAWDLTEDGELSDFVIREKSLPEHVSDEMFQYYHHHYQCAAHADRIKPRTPPITEQ